MKVKMEGMLLILAMAAEMECTATTMEYKLHFKKNLNFVVVARISTGCDPEVSTSVRNKHW